MASHKNMPLFTMLPVLVVLFAGIGGTAQAQSLAALYQKAQDYDASYQSARQQALATVAHSEQARAGILPSVNLGADVSQTNQTSSYSPYDARNYNTQSAAITATQPLYRPANWAAYEQGQRQIEGAQAQLRAAEQDLIVRTSQAYFDVLAAADNLTFVRSQKAAVAEQLASARRNFEVGTATVVDTRDAQARYDLVVAQELAADNDLRVKSLALDQLVGLSASAPKPLRAPLTLPGVVPADVETWVKQSQENNPALLPLQVALDVAKLETQKAQAGHLPTLDLVGSYSASNNSGSLQSSAAYTLNQGSIGVNFNLPLYAGRSIENRVKETLALEDKARSDLEAAQRNTAQSTRTAYLGLLSSLAQVQAYEAAQSSSQSALEANQLGYQVGVKINIDVLNAQSQLYSTMASLSKSRYDVLMGGLKLRQASGTLQPSDLDRITALLQD
jgi:outer membrane protein